jgi:phage-related protein
MRSLSNALIAEKNKISSDQPWLILLEVTWNDEESTVFRLVRNTEDVTFQSNTYTAFFFELDAFRYTGRGDIPTLELRVANATRLLQPFLEEAAGGVGSTVKITIVSAGLLNEDYSDLEETFEVVASHCDAQWVTFVLGAPSPLRKRIPLYRYLALHCRWAGQFKGVECKYVGVETTCDGTLATCRGYSNTANFGGFVGLRSGGMKVV